MRRGKAERTTAVSGFMETAAALTWIAKQIEEHAPAVGASPNQAARLAAAAAALRPGSLAKQVFGLEISDRTDPRFAALFERSMELLAAWPAVLDDESSAEIAALMVELGLPPSVAPTARPTTAARMRVLLSVKVEDLSTDEPTTDPAVLAAFDGARLVGSVDLVDIPCIRTATGGSFALKGVHEAYGWAHGADVDMVFDAASGALRCRLTFELSRTPLAGEVRGLLDAIEGELLFTPWGLNLDWDRTADDDYHALVAPEIVQHVVEGGAS
ncbi:MAG: hypothetical protein KF819_09525 [Labilithrix sp.]|nr:hypothetical protein [Labilithrix sp.]